ncbi:MAG TPA: hypothetical protein VHS35_01245 [Pseudonocardia sp.]|nr:hypothetical protein [Pseudonocardia sp.]
MRLSSAGSSTGQFPDPPGDGDGSGGDGSTTRMLVKPVFTRDSERRRKLLVRGGYLAAAGCVAYLAMVLVSVFASPSARPAADASDADQTSVQQVTPERPSAKPSPPPAPARVVRPAAPAPVTRQPPPATVAPTAPASATVAPSASAKPTKTPRTKAPKTTVPPAPVGQ